MRYARIAKPMKEIVFHTPLRRFFFPRYNYNFTAPQLCFLCRCIQDTRDVMGSIAEVGCCDGATKVFLNKYMDAQNIEKTYYAIDTFSGFTADDIQYEVTSRRKRGRDLANAFQLTKRKWFDRTMQDNSIGRVRSLEVDVNGFDLSTLGSLSFVLLDVDLYRPTMKSLRELYGMLEPSGIILVDDCDPQVTLWDGADQAYREFVEEIGQSHHVLYGKLGMITKPAKLSSERTLTS